MFRRQIYASPENFTPPLEVKEMTFGRSGSTDMLTKKLLKA